VGKKFYNFGEKLLAKNKERIKRLTDLGLEGAEFNAAYQSEMIKDADAFAKRIGLKPGKTSKTKW